MVYLQLHAVISSGAGIWWHGWKRGQHAIKASTVSDEYLVPFSQFLLVADDVNGLFTHFVHLL